jgi:hypothetical protein
MNQAEQYVAQQNEYQRAVDRIAAEKAVYDEIRRIPGSVQDQAPSTIAQHGLGYIRMIPAAFEKVGKKIPFIAAPFMANDYVAGINNAEKTFNTNEASTAQRVGSGVANVISGSSFGLIPQQTTVNAIKGLGHMFSDQNIVKYLK